MTHDVRTTTLAEIAWTFDTAGRITSVTTVDGTDDYTYDDTGQLTAVDSDYQTDESWTYDANGNRTNTGYSTGDNNRLLSDGTYNYTYDDEGNRTRKTHIASGDYVEYAWDHRNRLVSVTFRNSSDVKTKEVTYVYDVFDRRIAKDVDDDGDGTIDRGERYVYDGTDIALVYDRSDALVERLLYGPRVDQPLASEDGSGDVLWLLADNQGTVRDVAEYDAGLDTTSVVNHLTYGSFGQITSQSNSSFEPRHTYTAREWDADAELFYYRARWYDPLAGRFLSEDPLSFGAGDTTLSRYVGNSTINNLDPSGLSGAHYDIAYHGDMGYIITSPPVAAPPSSTGNYGSYPSSQQLPSVDTKYAFMTVLQKFGFGTPDIKDLYKADGPTGEIGCDCDDVADFMQRYYQGAFPSASVTIIVAHWQKPYDPALLKTGHAAGHAMLLIQYQKQYWLVNPIKRLVDGPSVTEADAMAAAAAHIRANYPNDPTVPVTLSGPYIDHSALNAGKPWYMSPSVAQSVANHLRCQGIDPATVFPKNVPIPPRPRVHIY